MTNSEQYPGPAGDTWQPPRCRHGAILLGCAEDSCPEQNAYRALTDIARGVYGRERSQDGALLIASMTTAEIAHCAHWADGDGTCHRCGEPNWCPDGEDEGALEVFMARRLDCPRRFDFTRGGGADDQRSG